MSLELTFKSVCATIKKQGHEDPELIEAVDKLLGLALICSPVVMGPAGLVFLPLIAVKNEMIKISKSVYEKFTSKKDEDYLLRFETMRTAYGLLVFTSFFDVLDSRLSDALRKEIKLLDIHKTSLAKDGVKKLSDQKPDVTSCPIHDAPITNMNFLFPHPTETLTEQSQRQAKLWKQMGQSFVELVQKLPCWANAKEKTRASLLSGLANIEDEVAKHFEAQYFELARKYEDFAIWANLQEHKGAKALISDLSEYVKLHAKLSAATEQTIDVGFSKLHEAVLSIPETLHVEQAIEITESFSKHYQARINESIIEDKDTGDENAPRLSFPKICEAFVPQAFRVLRQSGKSRRLEDEATWKVLPRRNDLGAFLLSYLSSPYSTETPLLILGHPGSGKSLLTTILSAQLMSKQFTAIRVPLREVNADADIQTQIEEFIKRISGVGFDSWIALRSLFKNCPPLIILDGYDELLQASGQVFASYIMEAQRFQQHQTEQGWPLRIIITSRVTLIDKAAVPVGSTIIRLLEFDKNQRECWTGIWNKANATYFHSAGIEEFALPGEKEKGAEKILNLAEQPLLLLMLALYDSQENQLRTSKGLDRTKLYDSLLRRFVLRERGKEKDFDNTEEKVRKNALSIEMQRLGVAALGMYNRRKVHILTAELDDDLAFFKLEREVPTKSGRALSQADLLLGSFFFVHKSKAQHNNGAEDMHEESSAFEFLHNTFGEFLTADFVIRRAVSQVQALRAAESTEALRSIMDKMMGTADGFERDWFASLVYTPLFTRPVILEMIREWTPHVLRDYKLLEDDFVETLEKIVLNQIKRLLNKREMPQIMRKETAQEGYRVPFGDHPLVGHIAIYSINLLLLRIVSGKAPFVFDECLITSYEDGTRPWDRLMHVWRSWFSLGNLNGLTVVMLAERNESKIKVSAKSKFQAVETKGRLHEFYNVALSLGDDVSASIAGLFLFDPDNESGEALDKLEHRMNSEGLDLGIPVLLTKLLVIARRFEDSPQKFIQHARLTLDQVMKSGRLDQLEAVCQIIARTLEQKTFHNLLQSHFYDIFRALFDPNLAMDVAMRDTRSMRIILELGVHFRDSDWLFEFFRRLDTRHLFELSERNPIEALAFLKILQELGGRHFFKEFISHRMDPEFFDRMFHPQFMLELSERNPEAALVYLQILRELGGGHFFHEFVERRMDPEFFDRMLHPRNLLELSERNPEGALVYLQILQELGGGRYFHEFVERRMDPEFFNRMFHPRNLMELSERNPEAALVYLQILRELGSGRYFREFVEQRMDLEFFDRMLHPRNLFELSERNPEGALAYIKIIQELVGVRYFKEFAQQRIDPEFFDRMFHPRNLLELSERNPEGALAYIKIIQELGGDRYFHEFVERRMDPEFFDRMFHPRNLLELSERNPEGALAYIKILQELGGGRYYREFVKRRIDNEFIDRIFNSRYIQHLLETKILSFRVWLTFARLLESERAIHVLSVTIIEFLKYRPDFKSRLSTLPIDSLGDLRWLSTRCKTKELKDFVEKITT